jgi:hypothetical protein
VDRESQKPIVVGRGGAMIKAIAPPPGRDGARDGRRIFWTSREGEAEWRDNERLLDDIDRQNLGDGVGVRSRCS